MDADVYQQLAKRTLVKDPSIGEGKPFGAKFSDGELMLVWNGLGLAGEAGEVVDHIKKGIFHKHGIDQEKMVEEIGDLLWYAAALCTNLGVPLSDAMQKNIEKLKKRYPDGFSREHSLNREVYENIDEIEDWEIPFDEDQESDFLEQEANH